MGLRKRVTSGQINSSEIGNVRFGKCKKQCKMHSISEKTQEGLAQWWDLCLWTIRSRVPFRVLPRVEYLATFFPAKVHSAFHSSEVGKMSTSMHGLLRSGCNLCLYMLPVRWGKLIIVKRLWDFMIRALYKCTPSLYFTCFLARLVGLTNQKIQPVLRYITSFSLEHVQSYERIIENSNYKLWNFANKMFMSIWLKPFQPFKRD